MSSHGIINGMNDVMNATIKSEVIDSKDEDNCITFPTSSTNTTTILSPSESVNNGLYSPHSHNRERHSSASSIIALNANAAKLDFARKSQHHSSSMVRIPVIDMLFHYAFKVSKEYKEYIASQHQHEHFLIFDISNN